MSAAVVGTGAAVACIPNPDGDFDEYQERLGGYDAAVNAPPSTSSTSGNGSSGVVEDSGPPPVEVTTGEYVAQCLSELANGQIAKIFTFWATTTYTPNQDAATGGTLAVKLEALKVEGGKAPATISRANIVGAIEGISGPVDAETRFVATLPAGQNGAFPGTANPISGSNVVIGNAGLKGRFVQSKFCARLTGNVIEPAPAARTLDENKNFCIFTPVKDGDAAPAYTLVNDYNVANCPL